MPEKITPTQEQIDRTAQFLRNGKQGGKALMPWNNLSNSKKKKWQDLAEGTLKAAFEED